VSGSTSEYEYHGECLGGRGCNHDRALLFIEHELGRGRLSHDSDIELKERANIRHV
jgi:hypothetical protein